MIDFNIVVTLKESRLQGIGTGKNHVEERYMMYSSIDEGCDMKEKIGINIDIGNGLPYTHHLYSTPLP